MKRMLTLGTAMLLLAPPLAQAQGSFGIKAGLSYGNVSSNGVLPGDAKQRTGFAAGIGMTTGSPFGLGLDVLYAQRGVTSTKLDYIDVPVYLRLGVPTPGLSPFAYAGPQVSIEVQCNAGGVTCPDSTGRPKTAYSGVIGGGVRFGMLGGFSLEGRYIYGLTDLKLNTVTTSANYKTRSFLILAGIGF